VLTLCGTAVIVDVNNMVEKIQFPALLIKGRTVEWCTSLENLRTCTKGALKNKWFEDLLIIDAGGNEYKLAGATFVRNTGRRLFRGIFAPKLIEVTLVFRGKPRQATLGEVKNYIIRAIQSDRAFWDAGGEEEIGDLLDSINRAASIAEVWKALMPILTAGTRAMGT
jgi:hypothetical protein